MAQSGGLLLLQKDVAIDLNQYTAELMRAANEALGLAVEAAFTTKESLPLLIAKALRSARSVAAQSGYVTPDTAESVLGLAEKQATSLLDVAKKKGYSGN